MREMGPVSVLMANTAHQGRAGRWDISGEWRVSVTKAVWCGWKQTLQRDHEITSHMFCEIKVAIFFQAIQFILRG